VAIASAVKPQGKHSEISHFLDQQGNRIDFDLASPAHRVLRLLRDDAHELANRVHRELRDMSHFYELASILPSINEAQRRQLLASFGSIRKIVEADVQTFSKLFGKHTAEAIVWDIDKYDRGENKTVSTFIVPLRFDAENGDADDLRPIGP
jgi:excinuclease UvrABC nuclease subunit